jgi:hypothetical protein
MENNTTNKKMLSVATSISMVLLSASAFVLSVNKSFAEPVITKDNFSQPFNAKKMINSGTEIYPFGVVNGKAYWLEYNTQGWNFRNSDISAWKDSD